MGPKRVKMWAVIGMLVATVLCTAAAHAGAVTLTLTRGTLTNVNDAAGVWQHQGGDILKDGVKVGQYALYRRVTNGGTTAPLNTAMTTLTLFFTPTTTGIVPQNVTMQGAHDFSSGNFRGSVSAASNRYTWIIGADAVHVVVAGSIALTLTWTGSPQLTLP